MKRIRIKWDNILNLLVFVSSVVAFIYLSGKLVYCIWNPCCLNWIEFAIFWFSPFIAENTLEEIKKNI